MLERSGECRALGCYPPVGPQLPDFQDRLDERSRQVKLPPRAIPSITSARLEGTTVAKL